MKPNLMQCVSKDYPASFIITDPKGGLIGRWASSLCEAATGSKC